MPIYKVYTGLVAPTKKVHRTEEEMAYAMSCSSTSPGLGMISPDTVFREKGTPEGFESEDITKAMRYANTLRKMSIYGGVWVEYEDDYGVRKVEYVHSDYCLYFNGVDRQQFIEGDDLLALKNLAEQMAKEERTRWHGFEIFDYYAGGRLLWRLGYLEWQEKQNAKRNAWAVAVFLLLALTVHTLLTR